MFQKKLGFAYCQYNDLGEEIDNFTTDFPRDDDAVLVFHLCFLGNYSDISKMRNLQEEMIVNFLNLTKVVF